MGPAKYLPTAIIPVTIASISIGLAPDFSNRGCNHCCVPSSVVAVKVIQTATKINNGVNNDLILFDVSVSIFSDFGNNALKNM